MPVDVFVDPDLNEESERDAIVLELKTLLGSHRGQWGLRVVREAPDMRVTLIGPHFSRTARLPAGGGLKQVHAVLEQWLREFGFLWSFAFALLVTLFSTRA